MSAGAVGEGEPVRRAAARVAAGRKWPDESRAGRVVSGAGALWEVRKGAGTP